MNSPQNTVLSLSGKSYVINKNFEKNALLTIINKLQTDLTQIKHLTQDEQAPSESSSAIISDTELLKTTKMPAGLKRNYEEKVQNLIDVYERKLQDYKNEVKFLKEDRESFVDALQSKQSIISTQKSGIQELEMSKQELEAQHKAEIAEIQARHTSELQILKHELETSRNSCNDLEHIRRFLEKNNHQMKLKISETQAECKRRIEKIAEEYETEKLKYKNEIKQIRSAISLIETQAESKIVEIENSVHSSEKNYETEIEKLKSEITRLKFEIKTSEERKQKLETAQSSFESTLQNTTRYYEQKIHNMNVAAQKDKESYIQEIEAVKERYEKQFSKLEEEYVALERDVELKKKDFMKCETMKTKMTHEIIDLKAEFEASDRKHSEEYEQLKQNYETLKKNLESENDNLKTLLLEKEKIADDLDIANKKYEKQYSSLKATIKSIKEEGEQDTAKMTEKLKNEKLFFQEEMAKLKDDYNTRMKKQDEEIHRIKHENSSLLEEIDKLESNKRGLEKTIRELRLGLDNTFDDYKEDIDRIRRETEAKYKEYESKIEEMSNEISKQTKQIIQLEEYNKMLQATNDEYKAINAESAAKFSGDINRLREELNMMKRFHVDDLNSFQKQLDLKEEVEKEKDDRILKLKQQITEIKTSQTAEYDEKMDRLLKARKELETENTILKHRLSDFSDDFKLQQDKFESANERLKKRFEEETSYLKAENDKLQECVLKLEKQITDQEKENKLLRKNLDDFSKHQSDESLELAENLNFMKLKFEDKILKLKQELEENRRNYENDLEKARNEFHENRQLYEDKIQQLKIECNSRRVLFEELEATKRELKQTHEILNNDEVKKLAYLGVMAKMKFVEK